MTEQVKQIAERLYGLRTSAGISVERMADVTNTGIEAYMRAENGESDFSFSFLLRCAKEFGVDVTELISGESQKLTYMQLTRAGEGMALERAREFSYRHLAARIRHKGCEPFLVTAKYSDEDAKGAIHLTSHSGEEFNYVLTGSLRIRIGEHEEVLKAGDSMYYDSSKPHGMVAVGNADCTFLAIVMNDNKTDKDAHEVVYSEPVPVKRKDEMTLFKRYATVEEDAFGSLKSIRYHIPDDFNFAYDVVDEIAAVNPDKLAMLWVSNEGEAKRISFGEMSEMSNRAANYFRSLGIKKGDKVMVILKRHYQFWYTILALHRLGAIGVPATHLLKVHDFVYRFEKGQIDAIIATADGEVTADAEEAEKKVAPLKARIIVKGRRDGWSAFDDEIMKYSAEFERPQGDEATKKDDIMLMYFTSGTTGYPRIVMQPFYYPIGHLVTAKYWHNVDPNGLHLTISDTGWAKSVWGKIYGQWLCESAILTYDFEKFNASDMLGLFAKYKVTTFCAPPTMYRFFIKENLAQYDLSSLKHATIAGEALNPEVFQQFYNATGLKLMEGFGQTESTLTVANLRGMEPKPGSMGKPNPQYQVAIMVDDRPAKVGENGEIVLKTDIIPVGLYKGYYRDEAHTESVWHDGYYHTGDIAWKDEDGYYWYVGRCDDLIKSSGYRIGPFEIESVIMELPYVLECAVTGVPDETRGQIVKATVVLTKGTEATEELKKQLQEYVKTNTAPYKYPRIVEFVDALPKTISGKIRRVEIRGAEKKQ